MASSSAHRLSFSSSSSSSNSQSIYDVFLSFRGEDTRHGFTNYLYQALVHNGICTFRDDENLQRGGEIAPELIKAIEGSRISVVVFSENYAHSKWCLEELAKIMECKKEGGQTVIPVFYHVDPSQHVRKQGGSYGEAFAIHERDADADEEKMKKIKKWRTALFQVGGIAGHHLVKNTTYESEKIEGIVNEIRRLVRKPLYVDGKIVGINEKLQEVKLLIDTQSNDIRTIGIYGIGGIGKTTITKILYNDIFNEFESSSFLENVRENSKDGSGLLRLQEKLLHDIRKENISKVDNIDEGISMIRKHLSKRKVLVVLDDVDNYLKQTKFLAGSHKWLGLGSRIIITTRDTRCLKLCEACTTYEVKGLERKKAIELFSWTAFGQSYPKDDYVDLANDIVDYTGGHPLALCVLGPLLHGREVNEWKSVMPMLKGKLDKDIKEVLEKSYVGLNDTCKELFLDIACFFKNHEKDHVIRILESCHLGVAWGINILKERCLITLAHGIIGMHDLLQEMGHEIVRQEYPREPGKWKRLWKYEDINRVFTTNAETEAIEGIFLNISGSKEIPFSMEAFKVMKNLRLLKVYSDCNDHYPNFKKLRLYKDLEFPQELRYLHWVNYSLKSLSSYFNGKKLVELSLQFSKIERLWKRSEILDKLKVIDLSYSKKLIEMPNFSNMPNLEIMNLRCCTSLYKLDSSIGFLKKLTFLGLENCEKLVTLPDNIGNLTNLNHLGLEYCVNLVTLPNNIGNLTCLNYLGLKMCENLVSLPNSIGNLTCLNRLELEYCQNLVTLPDSIGNLTCLNHLGLEYCQKLVTLPDSIGNLTGLHHLELKNCKKLVTLPDSIGNLACLDGLELENCKNLVTLPDSIGNLTCLNYLGLVDCQNLVTLPDSIGNLTCLNGLRLKNCKNLVTIPDSIGNLTCFKYLRLKNCENLVNLPDSIGNLTCLNHLGFENCENLVTLPDSIGNLRCLNFLELEYCEKLKTLPDSIGNLTSLNYLGLVDCENLVTLPNCIGNLTCLETLGLSNCQKLQKLPNNLRSLRCCLKKLHLGGCHLAEGALPSDLWSLHLLKVLDLSQNYIRVIPADIIQLSQLIELAINDCQMLEEIPELPSSLKIIEARGCPVIETLLSDQRSMLWSPGVQYLKSYTEQVEHNLNIQSGIKEVKFRGIKGIPEWANHKNKGCEVTIDLPQNWYQDNAFLGLAIFFHFPRLDDFVWMHYKMWVSRDDEYEVVDVVEIGEWLYDPLLWVVLLPKISISRNHRSNQWTKFTASIPYEGFTGSCGIHLIYGEDHHQQKKRRPLELLWQNESTCSNAKRR